MFKISFQTAKNGSPEYGVKSKRRVEYIYDEDTGDRFLFNLGESFTDFISLTGKIGKSGHIYFRLDKDETDYYTDNSHFFVRLKEYIDLGISNEVFFSEACFIFFLHLSEASIPTMYPDLTYLNDNHEQNIEDFIDGENMSPFEHSMRAFVAAGDKVFDEPVLTYHCDKIEDVCMANLHLLITHGYTIKKCENCGKYFIPLRSDAIYCDRMSPFNKNRTCKQDGALRRHSESKEKSSILKDAEKIKNARYLRAYRNPESKRIQNEYYEWESIYRKKKADYKKGIISEDQFREWLEENKRFEGLK